MKKQEVKEYLKKQYPKFQGFIEHTLVAEMSMNFANMQQEAINYTRCCESDSEQLPSFLYKHEGGLYFKHLEDTDITDQWNEYLKTR